VVAVVTSHLANSMKTAVPMEAPATLNAVDFNFVGHSGRPRQNAIAQAGECRAGLANRTHRRAYADSIAVRTLLVAKRGTRLGL
jgi:hypothetical protein